MGKLEEKSKRRRKKENIEALVLTTVSIVGLIAVAAVAPKVVSLLKYLPSNRSAFGTRATRCLAKLKRKGLIRFESRNGIMCARLTEAGNRKLKLEQQALVLRVGAHAARKWDGQWRLVIFDIPERKRWIRYRLREMMSAAGFVRMQQSVWAYPYDAEDFIALLKADLHIGRDVLYLIVPDMEGDRALRKQFGLRAD